MYDYLFSNNVRIRIWENENSIPKCKIIKQIIKKCNTNELKAKDRRIVIELQLPHNNSNYGLLGVTYQSNVEQSNIIINLNEYEEEQYIDNIAIMPDIVHRGIPEDYINGIFKSIESNEKILMRGSYVFDSGAHSEVGSSEKIFCILTDILFELLLENEIKKDSVEKIIKKVLSNWTIVK